jgi:hypothetical protein
VAKEEAYQQAMAKVNAAKNRGTGASNQWRSSGTRVSGYGSAPVATLSAMDDDTEDTGEESEEGQVAVIQPAAQRKDRRQNNRYELSQSELELLKKHGRCFRCYSEGHTAIGCRRPRATVAPPPLN